MNAGTQNNRRLELIVLGRAANEQETEWFLNNLPSLEEDAGAELAELNSLKGVMLPDESEDDPLKGIVG